ncbi:hypothetical protein GCM10027418_19200 [Mariniluteicoccus endophyticus]
MSTSKREELTTVTSDSVDAASARELTSGARALAESVTAPGIGRPERTNRAIQAAEAVAALEQIAASTDPYADGQHAYGHDLITAAGSHASRDRDAAADRLARYRQHRELVANLRAAAWADLSGAIGTGVTPGRVPARAQFLARYAVKEMTARDMVPHTGTLPDAVLDPPRGTELQSVAVTVDGDTSGWHTAALLVNEAAQLDYAPGIASHLEALFRAQVDVKLETAILADIADGAPTAPDFAAAEAAAGGAWGVPDLIVCDPEDRPKIVRAYAADNVAAGDRPEILPTAGCPAGTAYVIAAGAVLVQATEPFDLVATEPDRLGKLIAFLRYGRGRNLVAGAVQVVTVS